MADHYSEEREMDAINRDLAQKESKDYADSVKEIEKEKLYDQFVVDASLALREFGRYDWQHVSDPDHCEKPSIERAFYFLHEYGFDEYTNDMALREVLAQCDGKSNGCAREIFIRYISHVVAHYEVEAFCK